MPREKGNVALYPSKRSSRYKQQLQRSRLEQRSCGRRAAAAAKPVRLDSPHRGVTLRRQTGPALYLEMPSGPPGGSISDQPAVIRRARNKKPALPAGMLYAAGCFECGLQPEDDSQPPAVPCQVPPTHEKVLEALRESVGMPELEFHPESFTRGAYRLYLPVRHVGWARNLFKRRKLDVEICATPADFFSVRKSGRSGRRAPKKG